MATQIFDHLRQEIVSLRLAPGTILSRPALAESFGVSQTPIRDALLRLEQEALVTVHPQSSTMVAPIDVDQAHEAQFLRISLECEVATIALDPAAYDLATPERLLEDMHTGSGSATATSRPSSPATSAITGRCSGPPGGGAWELVKQRSGNVDRLRNLHLPTPGKAAQILADHHAHLDALKAGDEVAAQAVIRRHLTGTLRAADEIREAHRQFFYQAPTAQAGGRGRGLGAGDQGGEHGLLLGREVRSAGSAPGRRRSP